jgi:hypothetical protein
MTKKKGLLATPPRQRQRRVEQLYLDGFTAMEIHDIMSEEADKVGRHMVVPGTIRNDIAEVRKRWTENLEALDKLEGKKRYLSATESLRRLALNEGSAKGLKIVHTADQEIARLSGVNLKIDENNVNLTTIDGAREYVDKVMGVVWSVVTDTDLRNQIVAGISELADRDTD